MFKRLRDILDTAYSKYTYAVYRSRGVLWLISIASCIAGIVYGCKGNWTGIYFIWFAFTVALNVRDAERNELEKKDELAKSKS